MTFCYFLTVNSKSVAPPEQLLSLANELAEINGLAEVRVHTAASAHDPMLDDGQPPALVVQLFFHNIESLEAAAVAHGPVQSTIAPILTAMHAHSISQQAMLARQFDIPEPLALSARDQTVCTYLVRYEGPARDTNAWLSDYIHGHPPLMLQLPGLRLLEIFTRIDWCGSIAWPRTEDLQRNQVVFDNPDALTAALNSPLRSQMRQHYDALPPFDGAVTHFPMLTRSVRPS
ncbi:MAG: ethyl tert-butyl ether degradation protein EthD [Burkholderiaceae bacterium]